MHRIFPGADTVSKRSRSGSGRQFRSWVLVLWWLALGPLWAGQQITERIAAVVEGEVITLSDLHWLAGYRGLSPPEEGIRQEFYLGLLSQLIDQKIIAREVQQTPSIRVDSELIDRQIEAYRSRFPSQEAFQAKLRDLEMSFLDLRELIRRQLAVLVFLKIRFEPFIIVLPNEIQAYYQEELVPRLARAGQAPELGLVEEQIREILSLQKTNQEMERWLHNARLKARVEVLLFRDPPQGPNLPPELITPDTETEKRTLQRQNPAPGQ